MIGYLEGQIQISQQQCLVITNGVGYQVELSLPTLEKLSTQKTAALYIYTHVREDALELYGFLSPEEKQLFEALLNVSGVGPRSALALTALGAQQLITAVQNADTTVLTQAPRVGKKLAQKIIIDLKSKLGSLKDLDLTPPSPAKQEVITALAGMGFAEDHISQALEGIDVEAVSIEVAIKHTLQALGKS